MNSESQKHGTCDTLTNIPNLHTGLQSNLEERFAWKYTVHYRVYNSLLLNPEISQMNPVQSHTVSA